MPHTVTTTPQSDSTQGIWLRKLDKKTNAATFSRTVSQSTDQIKLLIVANGLRFMCVYLISALLALAVCTKKKR